MKEEVGWPAAVEYCVLECPRVLLHLPIDNRPIDCRSKEFGAALQSFLCRRRNFGNRPGVYEFILQKENQLHPQLRKASAQVAEQRHA